MAVMNAVVLTSSILATALPNIAANPIAHGSGHTAKPWHFMWGAPPPVDYIMPKSISCGTGGYSWPIDNEHAWPIQRIVIHSSPGVINGVTVTYQGSSAITHGEGKGTVADQVLDLPVDKWVSDVKVGCTGNKLSYLYFGDGKDHIEAGKSDKIETWGGAWNAVFQFTGTVSDGALVSLGANFSEVENPDEGDFEQDEAIDEVEFN